MQTACFTLVVAFILGQSCAYAEETYHVEKISDGIREILEVKNSEGTVLDVIDVYKDDGYQIIKPTAEDNVCLVFPFGAKSGEQVDCFKSVPYYMDDEEDEEKLADCGEREEILFFQPVDCSDIKQNGDGGNMRQKRGWCTYRPVPVSKCVRYEKSSCSERGFLWVCRKWKYRCVEEIVVTAETRCCY